MRRQRTAREGFTLVEVLVALAIFALISAAGVMVLSQVADTRFVIQKKTSQVADIQRLTAVLKSDLSQAVPRRVRSVSGRPFSAPVMGPLVAGDPVLSLVRAGWSNPDDDPRPSLQRVEYRLTDGTLERRAYPYLDGTVAGAPQILYRGVRSIEVAFIQGTSEGPAYLASAERPMPDAVRLQLDLEGYGPVELMLPVTGG